MTKYMVVGFLFRNGFKEVALIQKQKPEWQKGKLNGIGGKVESDETINQAMQREFKEEAGADISSWRIFCNLKARDDSWNVSFFSSSEPCTITSMESEKVDWYPVNKIQELPTIPNLRWLIPLAIDNDSIFADAKER